MSRVDDDEPNWETSSLQAFLMQAVRGLENQLQSDEEAAVDNYTYK